MITCAGLHRSMSSRNTIKFPYVWLALKYVASLTDNPLQNVPTPALSEFYINHRRGSAFHAIFPLTSKPILLI